MEVSVFTADGVEECEALLVVDLLRRAGIKTQTVAVHAEEAEYEEKGSEITSSHGVVINCDTDLAHYEITDEKALVIPGGSKGTQVMKNNDRVADLLKEFTGMMEEDPGYILAAVCAGPTVLGNLDLLDGKEVTCFPGCEKDLGKGAKYLNKEYIVDGGLITGRALGSTIPFALEIVRALRGEKGVEEVSQQICYVK